MSLIKTLRNRSYGSDNPFLITPENSLSIEEVAAQSRVHLDDIRRGDVVALVGDFNAQSIADLLVLIDRGVVLVPLTIETLPDHEYFFESACVDWVVRDGRSVRRQHDNSHPLLAELRQRNHPGLILFSTGTTGRPKAILHDMSAFLQRFETPRPTLRTLAFLLFDHIGGINTLLHTMFNRGVVIKPATRTVDGVLKTCSAFDVEALPTTPTFLRMLLMSGLIPDQFPQCVKIVTYGTERMDQPTLDDLCRLLPNVDFRQTFGMSELGILRVKSKSRNSLFMRIGGEGVEFKVDGGTLRVFSPTRMMGYLNAASPFDELGWYDTHDVVEVDGEYIKVVGRTSDVINVGGLKFMASEVERVALEYRGVSLVNVSPRENPITGQHVEMTVQVADGESLDIVKFREYLVSRLPRHMIPRRINTASVTISHRFKKSS